MKTELGVTARVGASMRDYSWIVVGAGYTGAVVAERIASQLDQKVLVIDRRDHIAGNAYDYRGAYNILVHKYGPHIFHTNSKKVWRYLSQFTQWRPYYHHVLGVVDGRLAPIPFNINSLYQLFPEFLAAELTRILIENYGFGSNIPILKLKETSDKRLEFLADYIYAKVFKNYTIKQWGLRPEQLDPSVSARVPVRVSRDDRYFQDIYQAMPLEGYSAMFGRILNHPNIHVSTATTYDSIRGLYPDARIIYTGSIDEFFAYEHGTLPYRSLRFRLVDLAQAEAQPVGTVNYPNEFDFTRITELKHLTAQTAKGTLLVEEYPEPYEPGKNEPYYPIPTKDTPVRLKPYQDRARALEGKVWFAGRLGDYAYYNMDQACARALALFEKQIAPAVGRTAIEYQKAAND